ncbi:3-oxoacyl-[acyl-carrier-protein] reductase [Clostridium sp. UBA4548]|uniref:3-oxoacyl-[acyl-carrier-protein] reductase n=1 Tax=Clostridium sp. UBA4548 TaxID=1946361 RepID=UPI0025C13384|nr:3-oxoacyl-[acyl-carrier-protein] reductase [Clostridium sp. UBA4548]
MLKGKNAIITGASRGIGRAIALAFAQNGANVVINYRGNEELADNLVKEIEAYGVRAIKVKGDISNFKDAENLINTTIEELSSVDILVNNAGITKDGLFMRMKEEDFDSVINTNLKGTFNTSKAVISKMIKAKGGRIINISSVVGVIGNAGQANYAASKAGVIGFTKSLAKEVGSRGITVNAIAPGFIESDMTEVLSDKVKEAMLNGIPLKAFGKGEDVANLAVFLASNMASYITGQVVHVDGGMVM